MILKLWKKYEEIICYLIVGVATTVVNWIVYALANAVAGLSMNASNILAWAVAVLFAFVTNKIFVFHSKNRRVLQLFAEFAKFIGSRVVTGIFEIAGLPLLYSLGMNGSIFGVEGFVAKVIVSVVVIILNYVLSKFLVFAKKK